MEYNLTMGYKKLKDIAVEQDQKKDKQTAQDWISNKVWKLLVYEVFSLKSRFRFGYKLGK